MPDAEMHHPQDSSRQTIKALGPFRVTVHFRRWIPLLIVPE